MKIRITVSIPNEEPVVTHAEVTEIGDTADAIREALNIARKRNPSASIFDSTIRLESAHGT